MFVSGRWWDSLVWSAMFNLRVYEPWAHQAITHEAQREREAPGRPTSKLDRGAGELSDQDLGEEEGPLDYGAALEQLVVVHAGDQEGASRLPGEQVEMAAPLPLAGSLWAFLGEAYGVGRSLPGIGHSLANAAASQT